MSRRLARYAGAILLSLPMIAYAGPRPGEWTVTTEAELPGMGKLPPVSMSHCITKEESESPEKAIPRRPGDNNCKVLDVKTDGNKMTWTMKCEGPRPASGSGQMTWGTDSYDGSMVMKVADSEIKVNYKGKRIGDCKQ